MIIQVPGNWILDPLKSIVRFTGSPRIGSSSMYVLITTQLSKTDCLLNYQMNPIFTQKNNEHRVYALITDKLANTEYLLNF